MRKKFEDERHGAIQKMIEINPTYKPPADYKPPQSKISEKVLIPQEEHPDINFVGLIIGPRGNTLKGMERETNAKIIIRGKGSVKEGKLARKDGQPMPGEDEPLHAFVTGPTHDSVVRAVAKINEVIRKGIELPENMNDLRRSQLRELALLNGTLRENEGPRCTNCGANDHRSWQCPDKPNVTNNVFCTNCNGVGHIAKDCKEMRSERGANDNVDNAQIDQEYFTLMAELGEAPPEREREPIKSVRETREEPVLNSFKPMNAEKLQAAQVAQAAQANGAQQQQQNQQQAAAQASGWPGYGTAAYADQYAAYAAMWSDPAAWAAASNGDPSSAMSMDPAAAAAAYSDPTSAWWQWYAQAASAAAQAGNNAMATAAENYAQPPPPPPPGH